MSQNQLNTKPSVVPLQNSPLSKKEQVAEMFDRVSKRYDLLNHILSMGIDKSWRKRAINSISSTKPKHILDVATGTGDFAIVAAKKLRPQEIIGIDISKGMMAIGAKKVQKAGLQDIIKFQYADSEHLPFDDNSFDAIICAYGVRNFENLSKGLSEMQRVLQPKGRLAILEFSKPKSFPIKQLYHFYFTKILPKLGKAVSKDDTAYTYLPESVMAFPEGRLFIEQLEAAGFCDCKAQPLAFGITTLYTATTK